MPERQFSILSDYENVAGLCEDVRAFCNEVDIISSICDGVEICLTEAVNNIIKHGYNGEPNNVITVKVSRNENILEINILDKGNSRENLEKPTLDFDPTDINNLPESGMGLFIIDNIMDETDYKVIAEGNVFIMRKCLD